MTTTRIVLGYLWFPRAPTKIIITLTVSGGYKNKPEDDRFLRDSINECECECACTCTSSGESSSGTGNMCSINNLFTIFIIKILKCINISLYPCTCINLHSL